MFGGNRHMKVHKELRWRNGAVVLGVIALVCICISSVTAVPQMQGSLVVERLDDTSRSEALYQALQDPSRLEAFASQDNQMQILFIIASLIESILPLAEDSSQEFDIDQLQLMIDPGMIEMMSEEMLTEKTQGCLMRISECLEDRMDNQCLPETEKAQYQIIQGNVATVASFLERPMSPQTAEIVQQVLSLLLTLLLLPLLVLQGVLQAALGVIGGLIRCVLLLVKIVLLVVVGVQSVLTLSALGIIFMGIMSKLALKLFTLVASPLAGIIASRITSLIGNLLGSVSLVMHSFVALALIFAIPLSIAVLVLILSQRSNPDDEAEEESLLTSLMVLTFGLLIKVEGTENLLHMLWVWMGNQIDALPEWPY